MPQDILSELRHESSQIDLEYKLIVTALEGSSLQAQLPVLERDGD
jgi:hypothetical protein